MQITHNPPSFFFDNLFLLSAGVWFSNFWEFSVRRLHPLKLMQETIQLGLVYWLSLRPSANAEGFCMGYRQCCIKRAAITIRMVSDKPIITTENKRLQQLQIIKELLPSEIKNIENIMEDDK